LHTIGIAAGVEETWEAAFEAVKEHLAYPLSPFWSTYSK
jgi:hypothetical protein